MILIELRYKKDKEKIEAFKQAHVDYVEIFYQKKLAYASGPLLDENGNKKGGLLVSRMTLSEAKDFIKNDPFFIEGIADFEIKHFTPTNSSTSFKYLIEDREFSASGRELFDQLHGSHAGEEVVNALANISPDFGEMIFDFAFGQVMARKNEIPMITKELISIAIFVAMGDCHMQIKNHIEAAVNLGATKEMIIEVILLCTPFVGLCRVSNALLNLS